MRICRRRACWSVAKKGFDKQRFTSRNITLVRREISKEAKLAKLKISASRRFGAAVRIKVKKVVRTEKREPTAKEQEKIARALIAGDPRGGTRQLRHLFGESACMAGAAYPAWYSHREHLHLARRRRESVIPPRWPSPRTDHSGSSATSWCDAHSRFWEGLPNVFFRHLQSWHQSSSSA